MKNPKDVVRDGYNKVSFSYRADESDKSDKSYQQYESWVSEISSHLSQESSVLDLGCGCGLPSTKLLSDNFRVTGVDISPVQIERAKKLVPEATFICADMCELDFEIETFDAIISFYAIIHVPLKEQPELLAKIWQWLKPDGYFLFSTGHIEWAGEEKNWLGVEGGDMYWSHADKATYLQWLKSFGFSIIWDRFIPEGDGGHTLIFAKKEK